jgi:hypothetical protein
LTNRKLIVPDRKGDYAQPDNPGTICRGLYQGPVRHHDQYPRSSDRFI